MHIFDLTFLEKVCLFPNIFPRWHLPVHMSTVIPPGGVDLDGDRRLTFPIIIPINLLFCEHTTLRNQIQSTIILGRLVSLRDLE